ncbi:MAG: hypothetical protein ACKVOR_07045 [Flavobacteriales bacterium]
MKKISCILCLFISSLAQSQTDSLPVNIAFSRITGDWDGYFEFVVNDEGKTMTMSAKCTSSWDGKKWKFDVVYDEGEGVVSGGKGEALASTDGQIINYNNDLWTVSQVNARGDSTSIVLEITGKEKRKTVSTRHVILVTSTTFFITEYRKEEGQADFVFSMKHLFRRRK